MTSPTERQLFGGPLPGPEGAGLPDVEDRLFGSVPPAVRFVVLGIPAPKGSKRGFVRGGHAVVVDDNPGRLRPWSEAVRLAVIEAAGGTRRFEDAIAVEILFALPRPKSLPKRRRIAGRLVPAIHWPTTKPDVDKLARAVLDPMIGILYRDDAQIVDLWAHKAYVGEDDPRPRAEVSVWTVVE